VKNLRRKRKMIKKTDSEIQIKDDFILVKLSVIVGTLILILNQFYIKNIILLIASMTLIVYALIRIIIKLKKQIEEKKDD